MNVAATGGDTALLDRLHRRESGIAAHATAVSAPTPMSLPATSIPGEGIDESEDEEDDLGPVPSMRYSAKRITARLEATR